MLFHIDPLRLWVHKVLPVVYDDSLSYYEVLAKVTKKLNEVIDLTEEQNQYIEEFSTNLTNAINNWEDGMEQEWSSYKSGLNNEWGAFQRNTEQYIENWKNMAESDIEDAIAAGINQFVSYFSDLTQTAVDAAERAMEAAETAAEDAVDAVMPTLESQFDARYAWKTAVGSPLVATTAAGMTDTTKVYVYAGSETGYVNGDWYYYDGTAWQDGGVYNSAAVVTDPTLSESGVPADAKAAGDEIADLKSAIDDITATEKVPVIIFEKTSGTTDLPEGISSAQGYLRDMNGNYPGDLAGTGSSANVTFWWQATRDLDAYVSYTQGTNRQLCVFQGSPYGRNNRVTPVYASDDSDNPLPTKDNPVHVVSGQYLTFSMYNSRGGIEGMHWQIIEITNGDSSLKSTLPLTAQMETQVDEKISGISDGVLQTGYEQIPSVLWARHAWDSYSTTDSRNFRVRCTKDIAYDTDVLMLADRGFYISGYLSTGGGAVGPVSSYRLQAGVTLHLFMRRVSEDDEEVADVAEFANALKIQTKMSNISVWKPTFTDVSMFERMGIGGDSYAAGGGIISGVTRLTWGKNLARQAGIDVDIYAKSGQTVVQWVTDTVHGLPALLAGPECGIYWLQHGINGTSTPEELGTPEDMSADPHPATFYGQYVEAIEQIKATFPDARIVLANIIGSHYNLYQTIYTAVNTAIANIATYCEVPLIDVAQDDFYRSGFYAEYIRSNHPTAMQNAGIAMANRRLISKCIQDNPSYFINYGANW